MVSGQHVWRRKVVRLRDSSAGSEGQSHLRTGRTVWRAGLRGPSYVEAVRPPLSRAGPWGTESRYRADHRRTLRMQTWWSVSSGACCAAPPCCCLMSGPHTTSARGTLSWSPRKATRRPGVMADHRTGPWIQQVGLTQTCILKSFLKDSFSYFTAARDVY